MSLKALSEYTIYAKYAGYNKQLKRRETWTELITEVFKMHRIKYAKQISENEKLRTDIDFAETQLKKRRALGSQRSLQFKGAPIFNHNEKIYNCGFSHVDRLKFFQENMYLLLCGVGCGNSVQTQHINKLPDLIDFIPSGAISKIVVEDSIEGWADAIGAIMSVYHVQTEFTGANVEFDYSKIRSAGSLIAGQFKAPGPKGLQKSIEHIRDLLNRCVSNKQKKLRPIDAFDVIMHSSDAVLSGGVRRSAVLTMFSVDDAEMRNAKIGNWRETNPQRARSNNSATLLKGHVTREQFSKLMTATKEFGEPGFIWVDDLENGFNPCQPAWAQVLTPDGLRRFCDIAEGSKIWAKEGWTTVIKKWSTGIKPVYAYKTTAGIFYGTENHRLVSNSAKVEARDAEVIDIITGEYTPQTCVLNPQDIMDGLVVGDGSVHKASNNLVYLLIGEHDTDYFKSEIATLITKERKGLCATAFEINTTIKAQELPKTFERSIPARFLYGDKSTVAGFLRGLYTANGSVCGSRVTLKSASLILIEQVQAMLSSLGILSYYTTNKATSVKFTNGEYLCKQSYDLNISTDRDKFLNHIGFIQDYKVEKLQSTIKTPRSTPSKTTFEIIEVTHVSDEEVFDITVDNASHTYWTQGCNVSNCCEIGLYPKTEDGRSGWEFCNLSTVNGKFCKTKEDFFQACRAAAIIGTLQAGYTDFTYIGSETKEITEREALIGVSVTGMMDNPAILYDPEIQKEGALEVIRKNREIADAIGIRYSARSTCVKPEGTSSCVLEAGSGAHPHHARLYLRRVQANKLEFPAQYCAKINPLSVEDSVWSNNKTDVVISFCCEVPAGVIVKNQLSAKDFLDKVKLTQENWVACGKTEELCVNKSTSHNVSNTCFSTREKFLTTQGVKAFSEFKDGDTVTVFDYTGTPRKASVKNFGRQQIYKLVLSNGKQTKIIETTKNHIWMVNSINNKSRYTYTNYSRKFGYKLVTTDNLKQVNNCQIPKILISQKRNLNYMAFCHGFVFGSKHYNVENSKTHVKIFDSCKQSLAALFTENVKDCSIVEHDDHIYIGKLNPEWKKLPDENVNEDYIFSFISGWFAADGSIANINDNQRAITITNRDEINLTWLYAKAPVAGFSVNAPRPFIQTEGYNIGATYYNLTFVKASLCDEFFICHADKYKRWLAQKQSTQSSKFFKVVDVIATDLFEDVYCVVEPETATFLLDGNILTHNCVVKPEEWDLVEEYIFNNQKSFAGISLLGFSGDKDYKQAPNTTIHQPKELIKMYGDASVFASGLIVDGLHAFNNDLWDACSVALGEITLPSPEEAPVYPLKRDNKSLAEYFIQKEKYDAWYKKEDWIRRLRQFSDRYFNSDIKQATYCLKDVSNWKLWVDLNRERKTIDWSTVVEETEQFVEADTLAAAACANGMCQLV